MRSRREKLVKLMNDLISFCFEIGMEDLDINFSSHRDKGEITVSGRAENPPMQKLRDLEEILNMPRQEELEEYYWALVGHRHGILELEMIANLVDRGSITYENQILTIYLCRLED